MRWLEIRPRNAVTVLDTHDGIGVQDVDADPPAERAGAADRPRTSTRWSRRFTSAAAARAAWRAAARRATWTRRQINCTFYDALGRRDAEYLIARAIQCFVPGIPQIYYVGLLAGGNDIDLLRRTGVGRDINRHYYTAGELRAGADAAGRSVAAGAAAASQHASGVRGAFRVVPSPPRPARRWSGRTATAFARLDVEPEPRCAPSSRARGDGAERRRTSPGRRRRRRERDARVAARVAATWPSSRR